MRASLSLKIVQILSGILLLSIVLIGGLVYFQTETAKKETLEKSLELVARRLSKSLVAPVWNLDREVIEEIVVTEMLDKNIVAVMVVDELTEAPLVAKRRDGEWGIIDGRLSGSSEDIFGITLPVQRENVTLGQVSIAMTSRFLVEELMGEMTRLAIQMSVLLLLIGGVLLVCISLIVSRPVLRLSRDCRKVAAGNFSLELDTDRKDEIGSLARSIAQMRDAISDKMSILHREIFERKRSERELSQLRTYLSNILDSMPSLLASLDNDFIITHWNSEAEKVTGLSHGQVAGHKMAEVFPGFSDIQQMAAAAMMQCAVQKNSRHPLRFRGSERLYDVAVYPLIANGAEGCVIRLDDITERARMEDIMVQTEKMISVGGLAAGMAHEINNPLAGIIQSVQVIQNRFGETMPKNRDAAKECEVSLAGLNCYLRRREISVMLDSILYSGERAAKIIRNMLSFSRKSNSQRSPCNLTEILDNTVELANNDYDLKKRYDFRKISIVRQYDDGLQPVQCDSSTIQQVFFNILKNGAQAISAAKQLAANGDEPFEPTIILRLYGGKGSIKVDIEDNGIGMDEQTRKRIFEPFFTTKGHDKGTGLGLSVSYFIICENHNGSIQVDSTPSKGSVFTVSLPRH